jgi:hypothetical protein
VDRDRLIGMLSAMTDDEFRQLAAEARPPEPTDPVSARQSIAHKAGQLWNVARDENGPIGSMAVATAARATQAPPPVESSQFVPPQDTGYIGSDTLRRTPFTPPVEPPTHNR